MTRVASLSPLVRLPESLELAPPPSRSSLRRFLSLGHREGLLADGRTNNRRRQARMFGCCKCVTVGRGRPPLWGIWWALMEKWQRITLGMGGLPRENTASSILSTLTQTGICPSPLRSQPGAAHLFPFWRQSGSLPILMGLKYDVNERGMAYNLRSNLPSIPIPLVKPYCKVNHAYTHGKIAVTLSHSLTD